MLVEYKGIVNRFTELQKQYQSAILKGQKKQQEYERMERNFLDSRADFLCTKVKRWRTVSCMWSDSSFKSGKTYEKVCSEEELREAKQQSAILMEKATALSVEAGKTKGEMETARRNIEDRAEQIFGKQVESVYAKLEEWITELAKADEKMQSDYAVLEKQLAEKNRFEQQLPQVEKMQKEEEMKGKEWERLQYNIIQNVEMRETIGKIKRKPFILF